jgi:hypothetical protein
MAPPPAEDEEEAVGQTAAAEAEEEVRNPLLRGEEASNERLGGRPRSAEDEEDEDDDSKDGTEAAQAATTATAPGFFVWRLTMSAGVSGLLFGYEYVSRTIYFLSFSRCSFILRIPHVYISLSANCH